MNVNHFISLTLLSAVLISLNGCIGGSTPPSRFYLLEPMKHNMTVRSSTQREILLALAPVRIPKYADRPQIVTAIAANSYELNELNRWAEGLDENITRVLIQNLSSLVPAEVVSTRTSNLATQAQYRLNVNILEFHVDSEAVARLTAQWYVTANGNRLLSRQTNYDSIASAEDIVITVMALNDCLTRLSVDIATQLRLVADQNDDS